MKQTQKPVDALKVFWGANRVKPIQKRRLTDLPGGMYVKASANVQFADRTERDSQPHLQFRLCRHARLSDG